jgi:hypothetical protein
MEAKNGSVHFSSTIPNVKIAAGGKSRRHLESYELLGDEVRFGGGNFDGVTPLATGITDEEEQEQFDVFEKPSGRPTRVWYDDYISSSSEATKSAGED